MEFDDRHVSEMTESQVLKQEAYILFYAKQHGKSQVPAVLSAIKNGTIESPSSSSSTLVYYISRHYLKKLQIFQRMEPIDNRDLCCGHGIPDELPANGGEKAVAIDEQTWNKIYSKYGGGNNWD